MICICRKVYLARLRDLGFSGDRRAPQFLGYFQSEAHAIKVAAEATVEGVEPEVVEEDLDIRIYESIHEYKESLEDADFQSAVSKLTKDELKALSRKILKDHLNAGNATHHQEG